MNNDHYFFCYSKKLFTYLKENNIHPITIADNPNNGDRFSLFFKSEKFREIMDEYHSQEKSVPKGTVSVARSVPKGTLFS